MLVEVARQLVGDVVADLASQLLSSLSSLGPQLHLVLVAERSEGDKRGDEKDAGDELADRPAAGDARDEDSDERCPRHPPAPVEHRPGPLPRRALGALKCAGAEGERQHLTKVDPDVLHEVAHDEQRRPKDEDGQHEDAGQHQVDVRQPRANVAIYVSTQNMLPIRCPASHDKQIGAVTPWATQPAGTERVGRGRGVSAAVARRGQHGRGYSRCPPTS